MSAVSSGFPNLSEETYVVLDLETRGLSARYDPNVDVFVWGLLVCNPNEKPTLHQYDCEQRAGSFIQELINQNVWWVVHNSLFDVCALHVRELNLPWHRVLDTQVLAYCWNTNLPSYGLAALSGQKEDLAQELVGKGLEPEGFKLTSEWWEKDHRKEPKVMDVLCQYNRADLYATRSLIRRLFKTIDPKLSRCYFDLEQPFLASLELMHKSGFKLDIHTLLTLKDKWQQEANELRAVVESNCCFPSLKWNSSTNAYEPEVKYEGKTYRNKTHVPPYYTDQSGVYVAQWEGHIGEVCDVVGAHCPLLPYNPAAATGHNWWIINRELPEALTRVKVTATGKAQINAEFVSSLTLPPNVPIDKIAKVEKRLQMAKTWLNYVEPNGRIYCNFAHTRTRTGRLATNNPNLQNIPRADKDPNSDASMCRRLWVPEEGNVLLVADLSQIELRALAYYLWKSEKDESLKLEFDKPDADPHTANAAKWTVERPIAKMGIFLIIYGGGAGLLSERSGKTRKEAEEIFDTIHKEQPAIRSLMNRVIKKAKNFGFVTTIGGRQIKYPELRSTNNNERARAERQCFNALIQGSSRDVLHRLIVESLPFITDHNALLVNTVHDECIVEVSKPKADNLMVCLNQVWQNRWDLLPGVRVTGDWNKGNNWFEAK